MGFLSKLRIIFVVDSSKITVLFRFYSRESNKRVNTDHFTLQNPTSTRPYWIPTRSVSSEAQSAEATEIFLFQISNFLQFPNKKQIKLSFLIKRVFSSKEYFVQKMGDLLYLPSKCPLK